MSGLVETTKIIMVEMYDETGDSELANQMTRIEWDNEGSMEDKSDRIDMIDWL